MSTYQFTPFQLELAMELSGQFWAEAKEGCSIEENLTRSLLKRTQDLNAAHAVRKITEGVHGFNGLYSKANHRDLPGTLRIALHQSLNRMSEDWRRHVIFYLHESCANFTDIPKPDWETFDEAASLEAAIDCISRFDLENMKSYNPWMGKVLGEQTVEKLFSDADNTHCVEYLAAALYLQQLHGELDTDFSPYEMGAVTAATVTGAGHVFGGALNNISREELDQMLQVAAAVLVFVLLAVILVELTPLVYDMAVKVLTPAFAKAGILSKAIPAMLSVAAAAGTVVLPGVKTAEKVADLTSFHENVRSLWNSLGSHTPIREVIDAAPEAGEPIRMSPIQNRNPMYSAR